MICPRVRKNNINREAIKDKHNAVDLVAKKLQAFSISKISIKLYQRHQISYAVVQHLQKKAIQSWFKGQPKMSLHQPFCTVSIMHYSFLWKWIMQNYSEIANQSDYLKHQDHWVSLTNNNYYCCQHESTNRQWLCELQTR